MANFPPDLPPDLPPEKSRNIVVARVSAWWKEVESGKWPFWKKNHGT